MSNKSERNRRLRKAKDGKIDLVEDILSTEELKGTYEDRMKADKVLALDRAAREEAHRMKLREFRKQEVEAMMKQMPTKDDIAMMNARVEYLLYYLCEPDAFEYLDYLRNNNNKLCHQLVYCLFTKEHLEPKWLESACARIYTHGAPNYKITMETVVKFMKAITGRKTKIEVEEDGVRKEFGK